MSAAQHQRPPLSALISQALVAFTIEFDNEFEHQMPHRTTNYGSTPCSDRVPWLVSMAMWVHCMRYVPEQGIAAGELIRRMCLPASSGQMILRRMSKWWGYLALKPGSAGTGAKTSWEVRPTPAGRHARSVWEPLTQMIEARWRSRLGARAIDQLRTALAALVVQLDVELPDYVPLGGQSRSWRVDPSLARPARTSGARPRANCRSRSCSRSCW